MLYLIHFSEATEPRRPGRDLHGRLESSLAAVADRIHAPGRYHSSNGVYRSGPPSGVAVIGSCSHLASADQQSDAEMG